MEEDSPERPAAAWGDGCAAGSGEEGELPELCGLEEGELGEGAELGGEGGGAEGGTPLGLLFTPKLRALVRQLLPYKELAEGTVPAGPAAGGGSAVGGKSSSSGAGEDNSSSGNVTGV